MENKMYNRIDLENEGFSNVLSLYDLIIKYYKTLDDYQKTNFDLGVTLIVNNKYFKNYKRSSINRKLDIIPEIFELIRKVIEAISEIDFDSKITYDIFMKNISEKISYDVEVENENEILIIKNLHIVLDYFATDSLNEIYLDYLIDFRKYQELKFILEKENKRINIPTKKIVKQEKLICFKSTLSYPSKIKEINDNLRVLGYINKSNKLSFSDAFKGVDIDNKERIKWGKKLGSLNYLLKILHKNKLINYEYFKEVCSVASLIFVNKKGNIIEIDKLYKCREASPEDKKIIDGIFNKIIPTMKNNLI